jgi:2-oxoisovalerate dehydrogenase E2 component (dihydrolipoyl transacylase)
MAKANSVSLSSVDGTGRDGRVTKSDLIEFLQNGGQKKAQAVPAPSTTSSTSSQPAKPAAAATPQASSATAPILSDRTEQLRGYRKAMAKKMTEALSIPHFGYCDEITMDGLSRLRNELKQAADQIGVKVTYMPFIIKACSLALKRYPLLNSSINKDLSEVTYHASHNIGIAVDTPAGLVVPNVKNCQNLSVFEIAAELNRIIKLAQENKLPPSDLQGGTFSLSNIGALGGTYAKPVVVVPEVCIGALGKIQKLPRFDSNGNIVASQVMQISWSADHRVIDGATIAHFSNLMKRYLEFPNTMLADMK